ncbi:MAG: hypothetical protein RLZZ210_1157 [Pseudomonadota bacterium]|jgi:SAM-dependent methyltransferase
MINIHIACFDVYPAFNDIIKSLRYACEKCGFNVSYGSFSLKKDAINIVFAGHKLHIEQIQNNNIKDVIIYNLEQVKPSTPWINQTYIELMRNCKVWDYSLDNINQLKNAGVVDIDYMPIGYTPNLEVIHSKPEHEKDIDVLFYGLMNERRQNIVNAVASAGLRVFVNKPGEFLDDEIRNDLISRAKVVLNLSYYDDSVLFEMARVSFLMANQAFVLSEERDNLIIDDEIRSSLAFSRVENIAQTCLYYVHNPVERNKFVDKSYKTILNLDITDNVLRAIHSYIKSYSKSSNRNLSHVLPKKLQIGSGKSWKYDFFNIDIDSRWKPDLCFNLNKDFPFDETISTWRFGETKIAKGHFDYILSEHVFEHLDDVVKAMTTCMDLLADNGILEVEVPYDLSSGAWQDPTHVRAFNENSWLYYTDWYWYIGWTDYRFDSISTVFGLSHYGNEMMKQYNNFEAIRHMPRVIDTIRVKLKKRAVTIEEKHQNKKYFPGFHLEANSNMELSII